MFCSIIINLVLFIGRCGWCGIWMWIRWRCGMGWDHREQWRTKWRGPTVRQACSEIFFMIKLTFYMNLFNNIISSPVWHKLRYCKTGKSLTVDVFFKFFLHSKFLFMNWKIIPLAPLVYGIVFKSAGFWRLSLLSVLF